MVKVTLGLTLTLTAGVCVSVCLTPNPAHQQQNEQDDQDQCGQGANHNARNLPSTQTSLWVRGGKKERETLMCGFVQTL